MKIEILRLFTKIMFSEYATTNARRMRCGGCHLNLTLGSSGDLSSPNFPGDYGANTDCLWLLGTETEAKIKLRYVYMTSIYLCKTTICQMCVQ